MLRYGYEYEYTFGSRVLRTESSIITVRRTNDTVEFAITFSPGRCDYLKGFIGRIPIGTKGDYARKGDAKSETGAKSRVHRNTHMYGEEASTTG